jgi:hypothetical protein
MYTHRLSIAIRSRPILPTSQTGSFEMKKLVTISLPLFLVASPYNNNSEDD